MVKTLINVSFQWHEHMVRYNDFKEDFRFVELFLFFPIRDLIRAVRWPIRWEMYQSVDKLSHRHWPPDATCHFERRPALDHRLKRRRLSEQHRKWAGGWLEQAEKRTRRHLAAREAPPVLQRHRWRQRSDEIDSGRPIHELSSCDGSRDPCGQIAADTLNMGNLVDPCGRLGDVPRLYEWRIDAGKAGKDICVRFRFVPVGFWPDCQCSRTFRRTSCSSDGLHQINPYEIRRGQWDSHWPQQTVLVTTQEIHCKGKRENLILLDKHTHVAFDCVSWKN